ncbi:glutathione ABC transporter substrate-binding protein [Natronospirillum operosum]|uniref:Glutathione ABC transporter substrate-binding protein n=1 Tax=Natronospirillum operosum TaxID=2759953 RepID=A0A4Z0W4P2_9GAMM|nr:glutathione ABC transporter substrate-binding protein [Natronospirillum operosum]TGG90335.1 glutathione ABC transporter substrate-binding protein [Natronospirillum operosum]
MSRNIKLKRMLGPLFALLISLALVMQAQASDDRGGDLVAAMLADAVALDPHTTNDVPSSIVAHNIYESLVEFDTNSELQPLLATSWRNIDDTTVEFSLREGVTFHDGSELTAEVVKANFDRVLDPDVASPREFLFSMIEEVIVVDDLTVQFVTETPFAPLAAHLSHSGGGIASLEAIERDYEAMAEGRSPGSYLSENPSGTGYFKLDSWSPGSELRLVRNEDYWGDNALLDSVTFKVVPESQTRIAELETGNAHIIERVLPSDMGRVDRMPNASLLHQNSTSLAYLGFNAQKEPFDDVRVRQAISMAVNKDDIVAGVYNDTGLAAVGPIAPGVFGYDDSVDSIPYDMDQARELLAEAGHEGGFSTTIWTNDNASRIQIAEYVQSQLRDLNIDVSVQVLEWGAYLENTANGEHDMFILGWSTPTLDADYAMYALFHSTQQGAAGNRTFFANDELDSLLDAGREETDQDVRADIYRDAQELLVELAPMMYLWHEEYLIGVDNSVRNLEVMPTHHFLLQDVYIEQ